MVDDIKESSSRKVDSQKSCGRSLRGSEKLHDIEERARRQPHRGQCRDDHRREPRGDFVAPLSKDVAKMMDDIGIYVRFQNSEDKLKFQATQERTTSARTRSCAGPQSACALAVSATTPRRSRSLAQPRAHGRHELRYRRSRCRTDRHRPATWHVALVDAPDKDNTEGRRRCGGARGRSE